MMGGIMVGNSPREVEGVRHLVGDMVAREVEGVRHLVGDMVAREVEGVKLNHLVGTWWLERWRE